MSILLAVLLGLIQGLTEFIPISSTAHMTIFGHLSGMLDLRRPEQWTATMAVVQLGTLLAVLVYFASDIRSIATAMAVETFRERKQPFAQSPLARLGWLIVVGSVPIGVLGLAFRTIIEGNLTKDPLIIAVMLVAVAVVMLVADRRRGVRPIESLSITDALIIGVAQALALIPGSSRSGTTISAGMLIGIERAAAARFSFLLSIPALLASGMLELVHALRVLPLNDLWLLSIATLTAALSGYVSIAFLLAYLRRHSLAVFAVYRIGLAVGIGGLIASRLLQ
ncbi:MAG: undecaprenyl-diphosphatase [Candidatus Kapaibacterium sp.]|nr:MAG: undecaprenyl-diphosphatase [Candidatus Kapabacteria bacterium]GIV55702.1 MAG: undecaprenyl-diphosphatase [Candidatus Kapabacteria bacterium]